MPDEIHFQWQNEFLLRTIYPMRSTKLRDFLVYFYEVDLWAEYKDKSAQAIEAEAQAYLAAQARKWEEAYDGYQSSRTYFLVPDVSEQYRQAFPEFEPSILQKINLTHNDFARYLPRLKSFNSEGFFVSQYITLWENTRKEVLRLASQKQRSIDVRRPDWELRPQFEKEIRLLQNAGIKMADQELDGLYRFLGSFTRVQKRRTELDKWNKDQFRQRTELASKLASLQLNYDQLKAKFNQAAETLKKLKQPADIPTLENYFRSPDGAAGYISQFSAMDAEAVARFSQVHKALAPFLTAERDLPTKINQLRIQYNLMDGLVTTIRSQVQSILRRLEIGGPSWPLKAAKELELQTLRDVKLAMYEQEHHKLDALLNAMVNASRPAQELAQLTAKAEKDYADLEARLSAVEKELLPAKSAVDAFDQALNLPEKEQLQRFSSVKPVTKQDIVRSKIEEYQKACSEKSDQELLEEIVARFLKEPQRYPLWLQYMTVHFSGMRYQSSHGSWANPIDLLVSLSVRDVDKEINRLDDVAVEEICRQKISLYTGVEAEGAPTNAAASRALPALATTKAESWVSRREMHLKGLASESPYRRRKALLELTIDENSCEFDGMKAEEAEERLKDMRSELPEWMWKEIVRLTSLKLTEVNSADWENPTALETAERAAYEERSFSKLIADWKQEFMTGWREEHDRANRLIVTRAVCNEVAEHIQHLRGHSPGGGLTNKPLWYQRLEKDPKLQAGKEKPYLVRSTRAEDLKVGASILWLSFTHKMPSPWQIANPISLRTGGGLLPDKLFSGGGGPRRYRKNSEGHVMRTMEYINEKGEKRSQEQWMRWLHEATVALVAETADGTTVLTFETALPSEPRSRSAIGVFKHTLAELIYAVDETTFRGVFVGYAPEGTLPIADMKEMLDWNKILRRQALTPAQVDAYWKKVTPV